MILIDTNVISELMRGTPSVEVIAWLNAQDPLQLYLSTITIAEIHYGLQILPNSKRRKILEEKFKQFKQAAFEQRVLSFDEDAAQEYGVIMAHRKEIGRPMSVADGQIAAIASVHDFALATRNIPDFEECNVSLINPFE